MTKPRCEKCDPFIRTLVDRWASEVAQSELARENLERQNRELRELLTAAVKYAREDRAVTPGSTRLARLVLRATRYLGIPDVLDPLVSGLEARSMILRNAVRCRRCGTTVESTHVRHMARCECGDVAVDGGLDYALRLHRDGATWDDLTVLDDDAHVEAWELEQWRAEARDL